MILLAALLVAVAAVMVVLGVTLGGTGWLYGAIAGASAALVFLAIGVARRLRQPPANGGIDTAGPGTDRDGPDRDPDPPPS